ncbi:TonB-dependent siderophore receptor [Falsirhodobacter halotolerans]|uniref:TonB-dependent siderophore receptor n=1 Tax=Falsirhodobacter halotolerans TaxID=1146892 RepID=UPI001FD2095D|nr:TonB-dependent siderophore receptor [Falsirhodobacter halotolerans]MCJ8141147.1 TonB-dependent siderophore receptor [Falsirhodobacter halotolerans]
MTNSARSILLAGASLLAVGTAQAQDSDRVIVLSPIIVQADDVAGYVATGAQAAKSTLPVDEIPQSLSVVTEDQIDDQGAERVGAALGYTAGVLAEPFGRDPRFDSPRIRGFDANGAQYVNGLRQGRFFGAAAQEIYGLQQIEVLRGPSSTIYGAGSPLGVINMVQKRARSFDFGEVGVGTDSNGSAQAFFDANRALSDTLALRLTGIARDENTQIEDLDNKGGYLAGALRWTPDDATTVDVLLNYQKDAPLSPTGVPFALTEVADGKDLRDLYTGQKDFDDSDREMISFGVEISHDLGNGWTLGQGLRYETFNWSYDGTYASAYTGGDIFSRGSSRQRENTDTISLDTRLSGQVVTGDVSHQLLFGADIRKYDAFESSQFGTAPAINWRTGQSVGGERAFFAPNAGDVVLRQAGAYAQDELSYGNWRGVLGLRYDWVEQEGERYGAASEFKDNQLTGRVGLSYVMANGVTPYGTYSTSFDPQAGTDIEGGALKPTKGEQLEVGVKYRPLGFDGLFTAALYDLRQTDVNRTVEETIGGEVRRGFRQIGEVKSRGLELEATAQLAEGWSVRGGYAYNKTEQVAPNGDPLNGNELADAPNHLASLWVDHDFENGISAGAGLRYIGDRYRNNANASKLESVTLVDLALRYDWENIRTSVNVQNVTDEVYVSACGFSYCSYGEGRTVSAKVAYTW